MSKSADFLKRLKEEAEESGYSGGGAGTVARIIIELGLHRYVAGNEFWSFWKPLGDGENEMARVGKELTDRLKNAGCADSPQFGAKITIKKDAIGRDPFKADLMEFIPDWQDGFELIVDAVNTLALPFNEVFYGRFQYKPNPHFVKKGEAGKTEIDQKGVARYPSIRLPIEIFANEAVARAAAGGSPQTTSNTKWSHTAQASYPDVSEIENTSGEILAWFEKAKEGVAYNNDAENFPLPVPPTPPALKKYIADLYFLEPGDIDMLIPF